MKKVLVFGAGEIGQNLHKSNKYDIVRYSDNNKKLWGKNHSGVQIIPPYEIPAIKNEIEGIIIASARIGEIQNQLESMGLEKYLLKDESMKMILELYNVNDAKEYHVIDEMADYSGKELIVAYTPGKVGSRSIIDNIDLSQSPGVFDVHSFKYSRPTKEEYFIRNDKLNQNLSNKIIRDHKKKLIKAIDSRKVKIITFVREPVGRNISAFFNSLYLLINDTKKLNFNYLKKLFNKNSPADGYFRWYEEELNYFFDINIYDHEFDREKGYKIIEKDNIELFIGKLEKMNDIEDHIVKFLGIPSLNLEKKNEGNTKWYSEHYREFKKKMKYSEKELDKIYSHKFVEHFYTNEEVQNFKAKYLK